jgi:hypothetical protein
MRAPPWAFAPGGGNVLYRFRAKRPSLAHWRAMGSMTARKRQAKALARMTAASLVGAAALFLSDAPFASAGSLVVAHGRPSVLDALHTPALLAVRAADPSSDSARLAADGHDETAWTARPGENQWRWVATFGQPVHLGLLRARFGTSTTSGVPTAFRWEALAPVADGAACPALPLDPAASGADPHAGRDDEGWVAIPTAAEAQLPTAGVVAQPTRRSWFVDVDACGVRLVIDRTNAGPPVVREVQAIESARDVLRRGVASDDGAFPGFHADGVIDGSYAGRWAGAPGKSRWMLRVDLREPEDIDRIRLVLGFDATSVQRAGTGRSYAIAWGPLHYVLEVSEDGRRFVPVASEPLRPDGTVLKIRRRLVTLPERRAVRAVRLSMSGATDGNGEPNPTAVPVVREIAAYRADDKLPILAAPWVLSVNANPSAESHTTPGAEMMNDAYHAKFLQSRFRQVLPDLRYDDRYARSLGDRGEPLDAPPSAEAGAVLESIEGDDPQLDALFLSQSSPPPVAVLSGSNDWEYDASTGPDLHDPHSPKRWRWDPLRDARFGGLGQLAPAVHDRVAPFMGFCGGAQILGLLEARRFDYWTPEDDRRTIDTVLRRTSGRPIRGFASPLDLERSWPPDPHPLRSKVEFVATDPLFADVAGPQHRRTTQSLPELHVDALRPDAFLPGAPLERFEVIATSAFCAPDVVAAGPRDGVFPNAGGSGWCDTVPEAFRSRGSAWPIIASQFHAEQWDFMTPGPGDPPESVADARLFIASAFDEMVDAYVKLAP